MEKSITNGPAISIIVVQFSFSNPRVIPPHLPDKAMETRHQQVARKDNPTGVQYLPSTQNVDVSTLLDEMHRLGYVLIDAFHQERPNKTAGARRYCEKETYHTCRFDFCHGTQAQLTVQQAICLPDWESDLLKLCQDARWQVRAFVNPLYANHEPVEGKKSVSINLESRRPISGSSKADFKLTTIDGQLELAKTSESPLPAPVIQQAAPVYHDSAPLKHNPFSQLGQAAS